MRAKEAISPIIPVKEWKPGADVESDMALLDVLPRLLERPDRRLGVKEEDELLGIIDESSLLLALGRMLPGRDDCCVVEISCAPGDYSASHIARAVEDADVHLVDLISTPAADGRLNVLLRVRCEDPTAVTHSLERYGYRVEWTNGHELPAEVSEERLLALRTLINV